MYKEIDFLLDCDHAYHNGLEPLVDDYTYDRLKSEARSQYPDHPYFQTVGATPETDKVYLPFTCGSLEKMKYDGSMNQWIIDNDIEELAIGDKLDGCTILVTYKDGEIFQAFTRGDGYVGRDITDKAKIFVPDNIKDQTRRGYQTIKGEVLATTKDARDRGYKKSRTFVAGQLNSDNPEHLDVLHVVFYQVMDIDFQTYEGHIKEIQRMGLPTVHYMRHRIARGYDENVLATYYGERKKSCEWDIDGLVCMDYYNPNHENEYYPSNAVAFKVNEDAVRTTVKSVEWEVKRSGKLQPVVHIEPVDISGSEVTKCTGFNFKYIFDNNVNMGAEIGIVLSGEIIPYITDVYKESEVHNHPEFCPSCGDGLVLTHTEVDIVCPNPVCEGKMLYKLENFLLANGVEEVTATTIKKLDVHSIIELMELDEMDLMGIEGFGASRISTILTQIQKVYKTTPAQLLKSFGITGIGKSMSADLMSHYTLADLIEGVPEEDLLKIDGIGEVMAEKISQEVPQYRDVYDYLIENGLTFEEKAGDALKGKKVVLTGRSEIKRNELTKLIEAQGGLVKGMSKSVDLLFTNSPDSTTSKMKKAKEYGIEIHSYDKLYEILNLTVNV